MGHGGVGLVDEGVDVAGHLAQLVGALHGDALGEVALALGQVVHAPGDLAQGAVDAQADDEARAGAADDEEAEHRPGEEPGPLRHGGVGGEVVVGRRRQADFSTSPALSAAA